MPCFISGHVVRACPRWLLPWWWRKLSMAPRALLYMQQALDATVMIRCEPGVWDAQHGVGLHRSMAAVAAPSLTLELDKAHGVYETGGTLRGLLRLDLRQEMTIVGKIFCDFHIRNLISWLPHCTVVRDCHIASRCFMWRCHLFAGRSAFCDRHSN